jgi:hypothetical protein
MIIILASRWDATASATAAGWSHRPVGVMTPLDLCTSGWRQHLGICARDAMSDIAVVGGRSIPHDRITGVLTRLPWVTDSEVAEVAAHDRGYVAAEMSAFLLFWLSRLSCPVLNRPTPTCLSGPNWRPEKWAHVAAAAGIPVHPVHRDTRSTSTNGAPPSCTAVTVVGPDIFGEADTDLLNQARCLAELAEVALLTVLFAGADRGSAFVGADTFPPLDDAGLSEAALKYLSGPRAANL